MSGGGKQGEDLSAEVMRQDYSRVRRAFANMLMKRSREILAAWNKQIAIQVPDFETFLKEHQDRQIGKKMVNAVIEWWRAGRSGMLRAVCMDLVMLCFSCSVKGK